MDLTLFSPEKVHAHSMKDVYQFKTDFWLQQGLTLAEATEQAMNSDFKYIEWTFRNT